MASSGMLRHVALVKTDVSEELSAPLIRVARNGEVGTTLAVTSNRHALRFLQEPHGVTSQKTPFFIVTAVKTPNLTKKKKKTPCPLVANELYRLSDRLLSTKFSANFCG
jgi:hypothetical protein